MQAPVPRLQLISHALITVAPTQILGHTPAGERRVVQILSGRFEGRLQGHVLPGGSDYQVVGADGTAYLDARYVIETDDGALILVQNMGIRHGIIGDDPTQ